MFRRLREIDPGSGIHCASISESGQDGSILTSYDIGRHNAVDKAIGAGALNSVDFSRTVLATSGRISSDMVLKAIQAGIPILVSQRSVTSLAAAMADKAGIAIVGRMGKDEPVIIDCKSRVVM
jgi:FdhD protein